MNRLIMGAMLMTLCAGTLAGCATTVHKASPQYKPVVNAAGSNGVIFLAMNGSQWSEPREKRSSRVTPGQTPVEVRPRRKRVDPREITYVNVKNDAGSTIGKYVMPVNAGAMIIDSLHTELSAAGYTVRLVRKLPRDAEKGVGISSVSTDLEQNYGLLALEGECHLLVKVDLWRNGSRVGSHDYVANVSGNSFSDQHLLFAEIMTDATQNIMRQAVSDIIKTFQQ